MPTGASTQTQGRFPSAGCPITVLAGPHRPGQLPSPQAQPCSGHMASEDREPPHQASPEQLLGARGAARPRAPGAARSGARPGAQCRGHSRSAAITGAPSSRRPSRVTVRPAPPPLWPAPRVLLPYHRPAGAPRRTARLPQRSSSSRLRGRAGPPGPVSGAGGGCAFRPRGCGAACRGAAVAQGAQPPPLARPAPGTEELSGPARPPRAAIPARYVQKLGPSRRAAPRAGGGCGSAHPSQVECGSAPRKTHPSAAPGALADMDRPSLS